MIKKMIVASSIYSLSNIILSVLKFAMVPVYVRYLSPEQYGLLGFANVFTSFLSSFAFFGLDKALSREYFDYQKNRDELLIYIRNILLFMIVLDIVLTTVTLTLGPYILPFFFTRDKVPFSPYIPLSLGISLFTAYYGIFMVLLQVRMEAGKYVAIQISKFLVTTSIILFCVIKLQWGVKGVLWGDFIGTFIVSFILTIMILKLFPLNLRNVYLIVWQFIVANDKKKIIRENIKQIYAKNLKHTLLYCYPFIIIDMGNWLMSGTGRLVLSKYASLEEVGIYTFGDTLSFGLNMIMSAFYTAYLPFFFKSAKEVERPQTIFSMVASMYVFIIGGACLFGILFSNELVALLAPPTYKTSSSVMKVLLIAMFFIGLYNLIVLPLLYLKRTKVLPVLLFSSALVNVAINILLVPSMGVSGAAWAKVIAQVSLFGVAFWITSKQYAIKYSTRAFWIMIFIVIIGGLYFSASNMAIKIGICTIFLIGGVIINYKNIVFSSSVVRMRT